MARNRTGVSLVKKFLKGVALIRKPYRAYSESWDHDHCSFCWATFMDPTDSDANRAYVEEHPEVLTEGYATTADHPRGADYHWVCPDCFDDFAQSFGWRTRS